MSKAYYQKELNDLRDLAVEFSKSHPTLAPQLSGPSPDPDVERILEGTAFLTGQIRQKLDDDFPELAQSLIQIVYPHYLRPIPSSTIMEFTPKTMLKSNLQVPAGTYIDSKEVEGVSCRFRTCFDLDVAPLFLNNVRVEGLSGTSKVIELEFELKGMQLAAWKTDRIRLYLGGDYPGAADVYHLLQKNLDRILIESDAETEALQLEADCLRPIGFSEGESILPYPDTAFPSYGLLQEYFFLKEKFLFLEITGLDRWTSRGSNGRFKIKFELSELTSQLPRISKERFVLHAVPAVNLFNNDAEPVMLNQRASEIRIHPSRSKGDSHQIYTVDEIIGHTRLTGNKVEYRSVSMYGNAGQSDPTYQVSSRQSDEDKLPETYLTLSYPPEYEIPEQETLTVALTCCNGALPAQLRPGDINKPTSTTSALMEFKNITPPTDCLQMPTGSALLWRFLSHLALNYLSFAEAENMKALLKLYIFSGSTDHKEEMANQRRVDSIQELNVSASDRLVYGQLMRGQTLNLSMRSDHFASLGDFYLFGSVLDHLMSSFASINCFTAMNIRESNSGEEYQWPERLGDKPLI